MGYFGGYGGGRGWLSVMVCATPDEIAQSLRDIAGLSIVAGSARTVEERFPPPEAMQEVLRDAFRQIKEPQVHRFKLTREPMRVIWEPDRIGGAGAVFANPPVSCRSVDIHFDGSQLRTNGGSRDAVPCGLEFNFPKVIYRRGSGMAESTVAIPDYQLFADINWYWRGFAKPLKIRSVAREHRTRIRATPAGARWLAELWPMRELGLEVLGVV